MITTTKTLLALCIALTSATRHGSRSDHSQSPRSSYGGSSHGVSSHGARSSQAARRSTGEHGFLAGSGKPVTEETTARGHKMVKQGTFHDGSQDGCARFGFAHDKKYVGEDEDEVQARVDAKHQRTTMRTVVHMNQFHQGHAHRGAAIHAQKQGRVREEIEAHLAAADKLKQKRDSEEELALKKKFTTVVKSITKESDGLEERRYAPHITLQAMQLLGLEEEAVERLGQFIAWDEETHKYVVVDEDEEGIWKPEALTKEDFVAILGDKPVVDQDEITYEYMHSYDNGAEEFFSKMVQYSAKDVTGKNSIYAEAAAEFFWRRAPAVFACSKQRLTTAAHRAQHLKLRMQAAAAGAYAQAQRVKMIGGRPMTQTHYALWERQNPLSAGEWERVQEFVTDRRSVQAAEQFEADFKRRCAANEAATKAAAHQTYLVKKIERHTADLIVLQKKKDAVRAQCARKAEYLRAMGQDVDQDELKAEFGFAQALADYNAGVRELQRLKAEAGVSVPPSPARSERSDSHPGMPSLPEPLSTVHEPSPAASPRTIADMSPRRREVYLERHNTGDLRPRVQALVDAALASPVHVVASGSGHSSPAHSHHSSPRTLPVTTLPRAATPPAVSSPRAHLHHAATTGGMGSHAFGFAPDVRPVPTAADITAVAGALGELGLSVPTSPTAAHGDGSSHME